MFASSLTRSLLGVVALLLSTSLARAEFGGLRDNGAFFSEPAKAEASRNIGEIGKRFKKDLVIETFQGIPEDFKSGVDLRNRASVNRFFEQWTVRQARQQGVNGIYILLSKEPAHLQVVVGNETQNKAFTLQDRDALVATMLARLRNKQNDEALLAGVNFVAATMKSHAVARSGGPAPKRSETANAESSPWGWVLAAVLGAVAAWVVVGIIRSIFRAGGNTGGAAAAPASGGGRVFQFAPRRHVWRGGRDVALRSVFGAPWLRRWIRSGAQGRGRCWILGQGHRLLRLRRQLQRRFGRWRHRWWRFWRRGFLRSPRRA